MFEIKNEELRKRFVMKDEGVITETSVATVDGKEKVFDTGPIPANEFIISLSCDSENKEK